MTSSCLQNEYHLGDLIYPSLIISVGYNLSHFWAKYWSDDPEEQLLRIFCLNDVGLLLIIAVSSASIYKYQLFQLSRAFTLVSFQNIKLHHKMFTFSTGHSHYILPQKVGGVYVFCYNFQTLEPGDLSQLVGHFTPIEFHPWNPW